MTCNAIRPGQKYIDTRDVDERLEYLDGVLDGWGEFEEYEEQEYVFLRALKQEAEGYVPDWGHGETLILDGEAFVEYLQELAVDCGMIDESATWPNTHIDWRAAALEARQDYVEIEASGFTYLAR